MGKIPAEERPVIGKKANILKNKLNNIIIKKKAELEELAKQRKLEKEKIDVTLPGGQARSGS